MTYNAGCYTDVFLNENNDDDLYLYDVPKTHEKNVCVRVQLNEWFLSEVKIWNILKTYMCISCKCELIPLNTLKLKTMATIGLLSAFPFW